MRVFARLFRLVWGDQVEPALRPVLAVGLGGAVAMSALWSFIGIWAIERLGASSAQLGVAFLFGALAATAGGYLGGHLSDHVGRKPLILLGFGIQSLFVLSYIAAEDRVLLGLGLVVLGSAFGSLGQGADQAMVADLVRPERHEAAYASVRVAHNLGVTLGAPLGGVLLIGESWPRLFLGVAALSALTFAIGVRFLPARGEYAPREPPTRGSLGVIGRDRPFLLFLVSGALAYLVYVSYETVLPISAVSTHGMSPSTWGFLLVLNPLLVTLFQLRLTRRVQRIPPAPKLVVAMLLMGLPLLLLSVSGSVPMFAFVLVVFVLGEMLWVPTSQAIVAGLAPEDVRGAYMGAFGSTAGFGFAIGPFVALQLRDVGGDSAMWSFFASVSVAAAVTGAAACGYLGRRRQAGEPVAA